MAEVKNLRKLRRKLKNISDMDLSNAVRLGAIRVERTAKEIVPVDTGLLRLSITHSVDGNKAVVGTSVEYAANVELGIGQRPQPYLEPALKLNADKIREDIAKEIHRQLQEVANQ